MIWNDQNINLQQHFQCISDQIESNSLNPVSSHGVGSLEQHPAHPAHVEQIIAGASLTDVALGGGVRATARAGLSQQPDEAVLPPGGAPAVPHYPEVLPVLRAVAHQLDPVVELDVGVVVTAVVDAATVGAPGAGCH